jgi:hypothetical protein
MNQLKLWVVIITLSVTVGSSLIAIKIVLDSILPLFVFSIAVYKDNDNNKSRK